MLDLKLADHSRHHELIRAVQWALIRGKQLTGTYASPYESKPKRLDLHPYRLCLVKQAWYLIARPQDAEQPRTFRITRFKSLRSLDPRRPGGLRPEGLLRRRLGGLPGVTGPTTSRSASPPSGRPRDRDHLAPHPEADAIGTAASP